MRKQYVGKLNVYREHAGRDRLSATFCADSGERFEYDVAPKCFVEVGENYACVSLTCNEDGSNPRSVKLIEVLK